MELARLYNKDLNLTLPRLQKVLLGIAKKSSKNPEFAHRLADAYLLKYINNEKVISSFKEIDKYYV